jgi:hypothetical protein
MSGRLYNTSGLRFCLNCEGAGCAECEHTGRGGYIGWRGILGPDKLERTIDRTAAAVSAVRRVNGRVGSVRV